AAKHVLGASERGDARRELTAGKRFDDCERTLGLLQRLEDDAFERVVVLGEDEIAEPLSDLGDDGCQLALDIAFVGAAHGQLCLDLRVMRPETELGAAVRHQRLYAFEQRIDVALAKTVRVEAFEADRRLRTALREQARDNLLLK